jgi:hypothetical protein
MIPADLAKFSIVLWLGEIQNQVGVELYEASTLNPEVFVNLFTNNKTVL